MKDNSIFTQIKEKVPLEDYLVHHLNVDLVPNGPGRMAALCPFHDEVTPSFKVTESDEGFQYWRCYGACSTGGTVIDAVMKAENLDIPFEAVIFLNDLYNLGLNLSDESYKAYASNIAQTKEQIEKDKALMKDRDSRLSQVAYKYLHNRGYTDETIEKFELAVDDSQTKAGRLSIPIYDKTNHPISVANRALFDSTNCSSCGEEVTAKEVVSRRFQAKRQEKEGRKPDFDWKSCPHCGAAPDKAKVSWLVRQHPKYLFLGSFDKSHHLYNQFSARRFLSKNGDAAGLFLVEGYADAWAGDQSGHGAICSYNGAQLSNWQAEEAAEMAKKFEKPVILIPDFDSTGHLNIEKNIRKLKAAVEDVEIDVVYGVDELVYKTPSGEEKACKDLGEVLQFFGEDQVTRILDQKRWPAAEWQIRQIIEKRNQRTGAPFHSEVDQLRLVSEVLANNKSKVALDHLVNYLAVQWERDPDTIRSWFYSEISTDSATSYQHLFKDIAQARIESKDFLKDDNVIPLGFEVLDQCFPGNGARPGQLFMALGKSGTGKAQPEDSHVLTPNGFSKIKDISVGDLVIDPADGGETKVIGVFPQGERDIYEVIFYDGARVESDLEHLWKVKDSNNAWHVKTLREIRETTNLSKTRCSVPFSKPVHFSKKDLVIDPYLFGLAIGSIQISKDRVYLDPSGPVKKDRLPKGSFRGSRYFFDTSDQSFALFFNDLISIGVLKDEGINRFLPESYLHGSLEQRMALLDGLLDSSGSKSGSRSVFKNKSGQLVSGAKQLVQSLGMKTFKVSRDRRFSFVRSLDHNQTRRIREINYIGKKRAVCIALNSPDQLYITDDFVVTHNTMLATQIIANMAEAGVRSVFFSLEQAAKSLFPRLVCQALDVDMQEAERLIRSDDPADEELLAPVREIYKNMLIIDNVPTENREALSMTPSRIQAVVQEANLTHFKDKPANVVVIDHLGILDVDEDAPSDVKRSDLMAPGYIMQRLFAIAKATNTLLFVLQQLPKEVPPGKAFGYDAGRGGSKQTDFCDAIFCIWRPEQDIELDDEARASVSGQYKLALGKNRYGGSAVAHLFFDKASLRIMPPLQIVQPDHINPDGPVIDLEKELAISENKSEDKTENSGDIRSPEEMENLASKTDPIPEDTQALLDSIGAENVDAPEDDDFDGPDPALQQWFD